MSEDYAQQGFQILPALLSPEEADALVADLKPMMARDGVVARRMQDGWLRARSVRALACHPKVMERLAEIYGKRPIPFQTLNFSKGSEQATHTDALHFNSIPSGYMCGVWVALEDIHAENGPLHYYPGSHRCPEQFPSDFVLSADPKLRLRDGADLLREAIAQHGLVKHEVRMRKGDAFIWASNLFHGGEKILNPALSRWSQVTHYYFSDCIYYTPAFSFRPLGQYFLRRIVNVETGKAVSPSFQGNSIKARQLRNGLWRFDVPALTRRPGLGFWIRSRANFLVGFLRALFLKLRGPLVYLD